MGELALVFLKNRMIPRTEAENDQTLLTLQKQHSQGTTSIKSEIDAEF